MLSNSDQKILEQVKLKGSKRFGWFISIVILLTSIFIFTETQSYWSFGIAGLILYLFFKSIGHQRRIGILLTILFFTSPIFGTIYWSWWAIPVAFGGTLLLANLYGRWITQPLMSMINQLDKSKSGHNE